MYEKSRETAIEREVEQGDGVDHWGGDSRASGTGAGAAESAYEACLAYELAERGLAMERQRALPVIYRGARVDCGYRIDLLVEGSVVVELKTVDRLEPIHEAQLLSYLKHSGCKVGLLINFNVRLLKDGIRRMVNDLDE